IGLSGSASGSAADEGLPPYVAATPTHISIPAQVPLFGAIPSPQFLDFSMITFEGTVIFTNGGVSVSCQPGAVTATMNRAQ
ncbi:MAG: hypothetical protein ACRD1V_17090, partial [Vicinamibacterales bacterium]